MTTDATALFSNATPGSNGTSSDPILLDNGNLLAFTSTAGNLLPGTVQGQASLYLRDLDTGALSLVTFGATGSGITGIPGLTPLTSVSLFRLSADGTTLAYVTGRSDIVAGDTNGRSDLFVKDLETGSVQRFDVASLGTGDIFDISLSADGSTIALTLSANLRSDVRILDVDTGRVLAGDIDLGGNDLQIGYSPRLSADGTVLAYLAGSEGSAIYIRNLETSAISRVAIGNGSDLNISADGSHVSFSSSTQLVAGDTNIFSDVYVLDTGTGALTLASSSATGAAGNGSSTAGGLTADGSAVVFTSFASNLVAGDTNGFRDVFLKNLATGDIIRLAPEAGIGFNAASATPVLSGDGSTIAFVTAASNVVTGDANGRADVFVASSAPRLETLTFDGFGLGDGAEQRIADGYGGFNWVQAGAYNPDGSLGYREASGSGIAFIAEASDFEVAGYEDAARGSPLVLTRDTAFDLVSASFSAAYRDGLVITARAYADEAGTQLIGTLSFTAARGALATIDFAGPGGTGSFAGARRVELNANDGNDATVDYFGLDDLQVRVTDAPLI